MSKKPSRVVADVPGNPLFDLLHHTNTRELIAEKKQVLISLKTTDSIEQAVSTLSRNKILSAPVQDENGDWVGFVDMLDILKHVIAAAPSVDQIKKDEIETLQIAGRAIALVQLRNVVDFSGKDPMVAVFEDSKASTLLQYFANGIHRVGIYNADKQICGIVSQSDIVRFVAKHIKEGKLKTLAARSLVSLGYAQHNNEVVTFDLRKNVLHVLHVLDEKQVSAVALVDGHSHLVGNFSASDLRGLYRERFPAFLDSVKEFLTEHSPSSLKVVSVAPAATLGEVVEELSRDKLHRVWIVEERKPVGVVTLTDIIHIITNKDLVV